MKKLILLLIAVLSVSLLIVSCAPEPQSEEYDVFVPIFLEDEEEGAKSISITGENMNALMYYMMCPPFTGFKAGKMTSGSKLSKMIAGTSVELVFNHNSVSYSYEYSSADDYFKVIVNTSDNTFEYVHAINIDMSSGPYLLGNYTELAIFQGKGKVLNGGHFEAYGTFYELRTGDNASNRVRFVLKSNGANIAYCEYTGNSKDTDILEGKDKFTTFDASSYSSCLALLNRNVETVTKIHIAKLTNGSKSGDSDKETIAEAETAIKSWDGFIDWNLSDYIDSIDNDNNY